LSKDVYPLALFIFGIQGDFKRQWFKGKADVK
jgi:hypothetical protein